MNESMNEACSSVSNAVSILGMHVFGNAQGCTWYFAAAAILPCTYANLIHITLTAAATVFFSTQLLLSAEVTCDACKAAAGQS